MTDHPIFFNSDMVLAILDGRKSQTRRIIKPQPKAVQHVDEGGHVEWSCAKWPNLQVDSFDDLANYGPYVPGDLLWVREKWRPLYRMHTNLLVGACFRWRGGGRVFNGEHKSSDNIDDLMSFEPSIHMHKWACQIWLKAKSVRVEQVQEISQDDAIAEGVLKDDWCGCSTGCHLCMPYHTAEDCWETEAFGMLWDSIYAKPRPRYRKKELTHYESYPWEDIHQTRRHRGKPWHVYGNPHVFRTEFERYDK